MGGLNVTDQEFYDIIAGPIKAALTQCADEVEPGDFRPEYYASGTLEITKNHIVREWLVERDEA